MSYQTWPLQASCPHVNSSQWTSLPSAGRVHKEECTQCFNNDFGGINICLACFNGGCVESHSSTHFSTHHHALALNLVKSLIEVDSSANDNSTAANPSITVLGIGVDGGFDNSKTPKFKFDQTIVCLQCKCRLSCNDQTGLQKTVSDIMSRDSASLIDDKMSSWVPSVIPCEHTLTLQQVDREGAPQLLGKGLATCKSCELKSNLWICLTCGSNGCGRQQVGGDPGNSHARIHFESSGHPLVVKLGTISAEGKADVYCYKCDDYVKDEDIAKHLSLFGLKLEGEASEKTNEQRDLEFNLNRDWSSVFENDGSEATLMYGPGYTGFDNIGSSCYMASALQVLFSLNSFYERYVLEGISHVETCNKFPPSCFHCQMHKIAAGLHSGKYSKAPTQEELNLLKQEKESFDSNKGKGENVIFKPKKILQPGIPPRMLKKLIAGTHPEFTTSKQQDSFEFLNYFMERVKVNEHAFGVDPTNVFNFYEEERLQCETCKRVRYTSKQTNFLQLPITVPKSDNKPQDSNSNASKEKESPVVPFLACVNEWTAPSLIESYNCPHCRVSRNATKSYRLQNFPKVLMVSMRRFVFDNWLPAKLDVDIHIEDKMDLEFIRAKGKQENEEELPNVQENKTQSSSSSFQVSEEAVSQLLTMGFSRNKCIKALKETSNNPDRAVDWLFNHMDEDDSEVADNSAQQQQSSGPNEALVEQILNMGMGFTKNAAKRAVNTVKGENIEMFINWLFDHSADEDLNDPLPEPQTAPAAPNSNSNTVKLDPSELANKGSYKLFAFITHLGKSTDSGHYVCHILKDDKWVLFNDSKVSINSKPPKGTGYIYFFKRDD